MGGGVSPKDGVDFAAVQLVLAECVEVDVHWNWRVGEHVLAQQPLYRLRSAGYVERWG